MNLVITEEVNVALAMDLCGECGGCSDSNDGCDS
jgi:hypothetical protein